jgi:hypothetical protein
MDNFPISILGDQMTAADSFRNAVSRVLRPLVRAMIARGLGFPELTDRLKGLYVEAADQHFGLEGKRMTDSRVSLLTGLQRKDVRSLRTRPDRGAPEPQGAGPLPRILARWTAAPPYAARPGQPDRLPRSSAKGASFETLAAEVSRDVHPRTLLDELVRLGLVSHDPEDDTVELTATAFLPSRDDAALTGYFGANLGDHAEATVANLEAAPGPGPFFERAVHYDHLTEKSLDELEAMARALQGEALTQLNALALTLQVRDAGVPGSKGRFRCGAYVYRARVADRAEGETP